MSLTTLPSTEMEAYFEKRTNLHISLVNKYLGRIAALNLDEVDNSLLMEDPHDASKLHEPERTPYVFLTWKYRLASRGCKFEAPAEVVEAMHKASIAHVKSNKHHPEYWDSSAGEDCINATNRDAPALKLVDATAMPLTYVAQMIADWTAMDEEKNTLHDGPYSARDWADKNVNVRWKFSSEQVAFIYKLIALLSK